MLDLLELELEQPVDAILSTATFHWIADHERLFARCTPRCAPAGGWWRSAGERGTSRPARAGERGARARTLRRALRRLAGALELRRRRADARAPAGGRLRHGEVLARAGAARQPEHPREFLATIVLGPHVQQLPEKLREPFMDDVLARLGEPVVVDYVRLNIDATA